VVILGLNEPFNVWFRTATFLFEIETIRRIYNDSFKILPVDIQEALTKWYLHDLFRAVDLLLCMFPYRDLQYGPKAKGGDRKTVELRRRAKLGWLAYHIHAAQKLLENWSLVEEEVLKWFNSEGSQYREYTLFKDEVSFKENFLRFFKGLISGTIAELSVIYAYLYNDKPVMPLGFMQHLITLGPSGPTLGDLIDIGTLTFIDVKSRREDVKRLKSEALLLMINTRLPVAIAVPRYKVDEDRRVIDENGVTVEFYTLRLMSRNLDNMYLEEDRRMRLEARVEDKLKPLMQNIKILRENAEHYLREKH